MQFQCDRCGKRYSTNQEIREGRAYRFTCRACGFAVTVRGPTGSPAALPPSGRNGNGVGVSQRSPSSTSLPVAASAAATPRPPVTSVVNPHDAGPPEGGYVEFTLEDQAVTSQSTSIAARVEAAVAAADPPLLQRADPPQPRAGPSFARAAPAVRPQLFSRRAAILAGAVVVPAAVGAALAFALAGPGKRAEAPAASSAPGLLAPVVYVGPITVESRSPEPDVQAPAAGPRQAARPAPPPPQPRRTAARESRPSRAAPERSERAERADRSERVREVPPPPAPASVPAAVPPPQPQVQVAAPAPVPVAAAPPPPAEPVVEEAPAFAGTGFRRPAPETPGCVEGGIRIPRELGDRLPKTATLRFAVGRDGGADLVQVLGEGVDPRLGDVLRAAVLRCRFVPGTDATGRPTRLWVVMPLRFSQ
ncbi:MAG TPA: hypothetical protein VH880_08925 [Anaeromyxobacteraceae bacterium]